MSGRSEEAHRPLYARVLRLRHVAPSGFLCFVFLEGSVALGALLALAELVSWWGVIVLPMTVALMVKLNDLVAGALMPRAGSAGGAAMAAGPAGRATTAAAGWAATSGRSAGRAATPGGSAGWAPGGLVGHPATPGGVAGRAEVLRPAAAGAPPMRVAEEATTRLPGVIKRDRGGPVMRPWAEQAEAQQQRVRQSAMRRYE
ncbi:hypothetical protein ACQP2F_07485 [Actinoplanes sp. CA-030573]|uniref:hypothetical protein n=1 Tax=Actinoplanes sp. CA-030573 TaxID=3239898 RepID=UPI003D8A5525